MLLVVYHWYFHLEISDAETLRSSQIKWRLMEKASKKNFRTLSTSLLYLCFTQWQKSIFRPEKPKICWLDFQNFWAQNHPYIIWVHILWKNFKGCFTKKFTISILVKQIHYYHRSEMAILASWPVLSQTLGSIDRGGLHE